MKPVHFYSCLSKALVAGLILTGALSTKVLAEEADPKWKEPYDTPGRLHFILIRETAFQTICGREVFKMC